MEADDGDAGYALLQEFFAGYPISKLRILLRSDREWAANAGAWLASELPGSAAEVLDDLVALLGHSSKRVRFWAVDSVLGSAARDRGDAIARAVALFDDEDEGVRWKAMSALAFADREKLIAASAYLDGLEYPLTIILRGGAEDLTAGTVERTRRFAVVGAARNGLAGDTTSLLAFGRDTSSEIRSFASDFLRQAELHAARRARSPK